MSVKTMTAEAIRNDLKTIALTWSDGIPYQQQDRVNALKAELKRRNEPLEGPDGPSMISTMRPALEVATTDELEAELRKLSTRNDEASQKRFADVRYELRRRAKDDPEPAAPARSQVLPRELELPSDDEVEMKYAPESYDEKRIPRRPTVPEPRITKATVKASRSVNGYTATAREDGSVVLEYEAMQPAGSILVAHVFELEDAANFVTMVAAAQNRAAKLAAGG